MLIEGFKFDIIMSVYFV